VNPKTKIIVCLFSFLAATNSHGSKHCSCKLAADQILRIAADVDSKSESADKCGLKI